MPHNPLEFLRLSDPSSFHFHCPTLATVLLSEETLGKARAAGRGGWRAGAHWIFQD